MNVDRVAIVLQVVSFILVTTDLLGLERLSRLENLVNRWVRKSEEFQFWDALDEYLEAPTGSKPPYLALFITLGGMLFGGFLTFTFTGWIGGHSLVGTFRSHMPISPPVLDILTLAFLAFALITWTRVATWIIYGILWCIQHLTSVTLFALERWQMQGTMLIIGSTLFFIASGMQFLAS